MRSLEVKPFTAALALDIQRITTSTMFDTGKGQYRYQGSTISDVSRNGTLNVAGILRRSSNIGMTMISERLTSQEMWNKFTELGFGRAPQANFPGVASGRLRPWERWRPIERATMAYGYGLSVSLLQIAHAYTAFARNGDMVSLTLLKRDGKPTSVQVYKPEVASQIRSMLEAAAGPDGAKLAQVQGYRVAGKSGTAQVVAIKQGERYDSDKLAERHRDLCRAFGAEPRIHKWGRPRGSGLRAHPHSEWRRSVPPASPRRPPRTGWVSPTAPAATVNRPWSIALMATRNPSPSSPIGSRRHRIEWTERNHGARVCAIGPDNKLTVSLGQPHNVPPKDKLDLYRQHGIGGGRLLGVLGSVVDDLELQLLVAGVQAFTLVEDGLWARKFPNAQTFWFLFVCPRPILPSAPSAWNRFS